MKTLPKEYEINKKVVELKDDNYQFRHKGTEYNTIPHQYQIAKLNAGDNSLLELNIAPDRDGLV